MEWARAELVARDDDMRAVNAGNMSPRTATERMNARISQAGLPDRVAGAAYLVAKEELWRSMPQTALAMEIRRAVNAARVGDTKVDVDAAIFLSALAERGLRVVRSADE